MVKKSFNKLIGIFGTVLIVGLVSFLVLDNLQSEGLTIQIPDPNSFLPLDSNFKQIPNTSSSIRFLECKIKQTTTVFDNTGAVSKTIQSSGLQGSPTLSLVTDTGKPVGRYEVTPKIFCSVLTGYPNIIIKESQLQLQVTASQPSGSAVLISNQKITTFPIIFSNQAGQTSGQTGEKSFGTFVIPASSIQTKFPNVEFTSRVAFIVTGTLNVGFQDIRFGSDNWRYPIRATDLISVYEQKVTSSNPTDSDGDTIINTIDQCDTTKETFNGFEDSDGCPDTASTTQPIPTPSQNIPIQTQTECNISGSTWLLDSFGNGFCGSSLKTSDGQICNVFDYRVMSCTSPTISSTQPVPPQQGTLTQTEVAEDLVKGKILTLITFNYADGTTEKIFSDQLQSSNTGIFQTSSLLGSPALPIDKKPINSISFEVFYTRDTLEEAQSVTLKSSGITTALNIKIASQNKLLNKVVLTGGVENTGSTISGTYYGVSLGKRTISASDIEANSSDLLPTVGQNDAFLTLLIDGVANLQKAGISKQVSVTGAFVTLDNIIVTKETQVDPDCTKLGLILSVNELGQKVCVPQEEGDNQCVSPIRTVFSCTDEFVTLYCNNSNPHMCTEQDSDLDGTPDFLDQCNGEKEDGKTTPQSSANDGCSSEISQCADTNVCQPKDDDIDDDGYPNDVDQCPNVAGSDSNGCPMPKTGDADGDGVPDSSDACPTVAGSPQNNGCHVQSIYGSDDSGKLCTDSQGQKIVCIPEIPDTLIWVLAGGLFVVGIIVVIVKRR